jgi:HEPN domain-containing protein
VKWPGRGCALSDDTPGILWVKAIHDYNAAEKLLDSDPEIVGDQVFGLLLQQSVEKSIKSLLWRKKLRYSRIHNVSVLLDTLSKAIDIPPGFEKLRGLTMYASTERYESPLSPHRLDRRGLLDLVREFLSLLDRETW